jgi:hypothetical protein
MKTLILVVLALTGAPLWAQSAFDGTWKMNPQSAEFSAHEKYLLQNGTWKCDTCVPKISVKADGKPQKVSGSPYFDTITVTEANDHTVEFTRTKDGKEVGKETLTASEDGNKLTTEFSVTSEGGQQGSGKGYYERTATAPAGANKVSGTWKPAKYENGSDSLLTFSFKSTDNGLSMSDGQGDSYTAKFDGKDYPYKGDPGTTSVVVKKIDANTIEETDKRNGKTISVARMTVAPDGKTMKMTIEDKLHNSNFSWTADKQQ